MQKRVFLAGSSASDAAALANRTAAERKADGAHGIPNVEAWTHTGRKVRFYDDLVQGRVVTLNVFFTSCGEICPLITRNLRTVQDLLGERVGQIKRNSNEVWVLENSSGGWEHPVHIHLEEGQAFRVNGVQVAERHRLRSDVHHLWDNASLIEVFMSFRDFPDPVFSAPSVAEAGRYALHRHNTMH